MARSLQLLLVLLQVVVCVSAPPRLLPYSGLSRNQLITKYFFDGYPYKTILILLGLLHGISLSLRQLKRILRRSGLHRRTVLTFAHLHRVETQIRRELQGSSVLLGYRSLWHRIRQKHGLVVARSTVMRLLPFINPEDSLRRRQHKLKRRTFYIKGPNEAWSLDGYDKLKHYGFCLHGCIDAYSRRVLWLEAGITNNNPKVIAWYYLRCVKQIQGAPKLVRCDCGTENSVIAYLQPFLREDFTSFRYGSSVSNQRMEAFWSILRKWCTDWWINFFQGLIHEGLFEESNFIHRDSLRFCFMHIIQKELDGVVQLWNTHRIRRNEYNTSTGIPDEMYLLPHLNGTRDYKTVVDVHSLQYAQQYASSPPPPVSLEYLKAAEIIMLENNISHMPQDTTEALQLFFLLVTVLETYI